MKIIMAIGLSCILALPLHASNFRIDQLSGSFISPSGTAQVTRLELPERSPIVNETLALELIGQETLQISTKDETFEWEEVPSIISEMTGAQWSNINLNKSTNGLSISGASLQTVSASRDLNLRQLSLNCQLPNHHEDSLTQAILNGCLNGRGQASLRLFEMTNRKSQSITQSFFEAMGVNIRNEILSTDRFENVELNIQGDDFSGQITTRVVINATVRLNGKIYYEENNERIRIRVDRARAGLFSVMGTLFDELDKLDSDSIQVQRPWITINLAE